MDNDRFNQVIKQSLQDICSESGVETAVKRINSALRGEYIYINKGNALAERNQRIRNRSENAEELSREYHLSHRQIQRIKRQTPKKSFA